MRFDTWQEFFKTDTIVTNMRRARSSEHDNYITEEERYRHFKARLLEEVVAVEPRYPYINDNDVLRVGQPIPLKDKDSKCK